jgi:hypothetical protein
VQRVRGQSPQAPSSGRQLLDDRHVVEQCVKLISRGVGIGLVRRLVDPVLQLGRGRGGRARSGPLASQQETMVDEPASVHTYQAHRHAASVLPDRCVHRGAVLRALRGAHREAHRAAHAVPALQRWR